MILARGGIYRGKQAGVTGTIGEFFTADAPFFAEPVHADGSLWQTQQSALALS